MTRYDAKTGTLLIKNVEKIMFKLKASACDVGAFIESNNITTPLKQFLYPNTFWATWRWVSNCFSAFQCRMKIDIYL